MKRPSTIDGALGLLALLLAFALLLTAVLLAFSEPREPATRSRPVALEPRDTVPTTSVVTPAPRRQTSERAGRTRRVVAPVSSPRPTRTQRQERRDGLNWTALFECESGNNPRAVSPSGKYRGLAQFDLRTWRSVGGKGDPIDASRAEQTYRAQRLYAQRGRSPWPNCGRYL